MSIEYRIGDVPCWPWVRRIGDNGYGYWGKQLAHRRLYELLVGPIPDGLELDHLCRNPSCVNPRHLEPVTHAENVRRGMAGRVNAERMLARRECVNGHPFTDETTSTSPGYRRCLICSRERSRRAWATRFITCADCERQRPHAAHGLCGNCYKKRRRAA